MPNRIGRRTLYLCASLAWIGAAEAVIFGAYWLALFIELLPISEGGAVERAIALDGAAAVFAAVTLIHGGMGALREARVKKTKAKESAKDGLSWRAFALLALGSAVLGAFLANRMGLLTGLYASAPPSSSAVLIALHLLKGRKERRRPKKAPQMPAPYV